MIIHRGRLLPCSYRPKPRLSFRCLRVAHNAPDYWPAPVTEPHIVVVLVPMVRTTAFATRYKKKLCVNDLRMCHRGYLAWNTFVECGPAGTDDLWSTI